MVIHSGWRCVILLGVLVGCNRSDKPAATTTTDSAQSRVTLPSEKTDTIVIEGNKQAIKLRLVRPPSALPYVTYLPEDMISETHISRLGEAHYFYANFGGTRNNQAFLVMKLLPAGAKMVDAITAAKAFRDEGDAHRFVTKVDVRQHGDRFYFLGEHYPPEYGDGFPPRSQIVQREWQWLALKPSAPPRV